MKVKQGSALAGYGFGTFQGVFTPSILTIIGVVMYLRFGWMLGNVGLPTSLLIVTIGSTITLLTGLSISSLATNMRVRGGGAYFILSRSLGLEAGAALGIPLALSQTVCVSFYVAGFAEALVNSGLPVVSGFDPRLVGIATLAALALLSTLSADVALKSQYLIMAAIAFSLVSFFLGGAPEGLAAPDAASVPPALDFWTVFAVFFPAVTGILSGLGMSGDLKDPSRSIPVGTISAVLVGYAIYMAVPIVLDFMVPDAAILRTDTMILQKCARWDMAILVGVWAATLSSAVGSFLVAPRVLQALSRDRLMPHMFGRGFGRADDPRLSSFFCFCLAAVCVWLGDINAIAPALTLFNLSTYGLLNFCAAVEEAMSNPSWRPTFRVKAFFSFLGFALCLSAMLMISPGWTFVALICEGAIYWLVKRRALRAQWGDMRTGLYAELVRHALPHLANTRHAERNWRPNILALMQLPIQDRRLMELANGISGGRSLVTIASVLPKGFSNSERENEVGAAVVRASERIGLKANVKLIDAEDDWSGMFELVRAYGFGPIVPNTVIVGAPVSEACVRFAELSMLTSRMGRNLLIVGDAGTPPERGGVIDIWWRGGGANGGLMLALAFLLKRNGFAATGLRVNMIVQNRTREEAESELAKYLKDARVDAETRVIESEGRPFADIIRDSSSDASMSFVGLRQPRADEPAVSYGDYFSLLRDALGGVPQTIFVLAAEGIDFRRIFE
ncbi:MAG: Na-K-Cl cotransporter [Kiritimatiellae bacterium]|nr:Na-K-Cl cotransporter [Kiritimatiellia bacterium]